MKRILYKSFALVLVAAFTITGFTGCTKEYITEEYITNEGDIIGTEYYNDYFTVGDDKNPWHWNEVNERYECYFPLEMLTKEIYDDGTMIGNVFIEPGLPSEWLELLPYQTVYYYDDEVTGEKKTYTVNIGCAFVPGEVGFYFQLSDRKRVDSILEVFEFKVSLIWGNNTEGE